MDAAGNGIIIDCFEQRKNCDFDVSILEMYVQIKELTPSEIKVYRYPRQWLCAVTI